MTEPADSDWTRPLPDLEGSVIAGVVTDFEGIPLTGVRVEAATSRGEPLDMLPVLSDGEGRFRLTGLGEGAFDLRFSMGQVKARTLGVPAGTADLKVRLARPQGILLTVRMERGKEEPGLVRLVLDRETDRGPVREHVGRLVRLRALLWSLRPGRYTLTVWGGPYLPVVAGGIEVLEGRPAPGVEVVLGAEGGTVAGRVLSHGRPVEALVGWRRLDAAGPWPPMETSVASDASGRYAIRGLPAGRYRVYAGHPTGPIAQADVDVAEEAATSLDLLLGGP